MMYNNDWLIKLYNQKHKIKYIFFWGHQPSKSGEITQSCFSQWWHSPFEFESEIYPTAEHWMMAQKAILFNDIEIKEKILQAVSPNKAKSLGRLIKNFNQKVWDDEKYNIVVQGNFLKFSQNHSLKTYLLNTNNRILVEASPVDSIWGIGMAQDHSNIENPTLWKGENLLGYALMEVRDTLLTL